MVTDEQRPTPEQAMAEKRAALHRIAVEDPDSGSLSEDEERERSEWPQ